MKAVVWHKECNVYSEIIWTKEKLLYGRCNQEPHVKVLQAGMFSVSQLPTIPIHNSLALHTKCSEKRCLDNLVGRYNLQHLGAGQNS